MSNKQWLSLFLHAFLLASSPVTLAQDAVPAAPTTQQMIDALTARPVGAPAAAPAQPKRKTRNLGVEINTLPEGGAAPAPSAPAPAPAPAPVPSINLAIQFEVNSDRVLPASMKLLANLAQALQTPELLPMRFLVEGHTDGNGKPAYNKRLSAQRAEQVKRALVQHHVDASRIVAEGKGSSELLNPAMPGAPENRRVRIVMLGK
ncbi:OmpA family protein [Duganella violaceipulchra]|uniref:OmpA family protein n=1 Tax=Duganella violaceipulchra TaxID=2849652 RepID=A0AA41HCR8_9BURK|nr:OmpA family protein [Duganella violaceicalia]MBV6324914.1 OmpA family protein [Duganella violaceicalia]MCP2012338.1 outer membrane protein OmpA-like peptidoglycan-associated protein [Duganella violaceicalia]